MILLAFLLPIATSAETIYVCDEGQVGIKSQIYCKGGEDSILDTLLVKHKLFPDDSKNFTDSALKYDPAEVISNFNSTNKTSKADVQKFYDDNFHKPGSELETCTPSDWKQSPGTFDVIIDKEYREWAGRLHEIWKELCKKAKPDLKDERNSLIPLPHEFIAPGDRFREPYYWDTYWIIKGLIVSEMYDTVERMILNLATMCERYGFVPNGGRIYYLHRSQPPFLTLMVYNYIEAADKYDFLDQKVINRTVFEVLEIEFNYWVENCMENITTAAGDRYTAFRYWTASNTPRPESYDKDVHTADNVPEAKRPAVYNTLATMAASGLDFSCKWLTNCSELSSSIITSILPVELNAYMCQNAKLMMYFSIKKDDYSKLAHYRTFHQNSMRAMRELFWDEKDGIWFDYRMDKQELRKEHTFITSVVPLFARCYDTYDTERVKRAYDYLMGQNFFSYPNGVPFSLISSQQWDFPMAWPPMMHMLVEALRRSFNPRHYELAYNISSKWVADNYLTYKKTKFMYEKYNVTSTDYTGPGSAGEYETQKGFGWTNGVILDFLHTYGARLEAPSSGATAAVSGSGS